MSAFHRIKPAEAEEKSSSPPVDPALRQYYDRHYLLENIPAKIIKNAWFTMAHLLMKPGARIVDVGCGNGMMSYAMAVLNPQIHITAIDRDKRQIAAAAKNYQRPNLSFQTGDMIGENGFEENSLDGIINAFVLHEIYSGSHYSERPVIRTLENQFALLKDEGFLFIHDYAMPPPDEYVLLEMPDEPGTGPDVVDLSEADLLVWYAEHARPREETGCQGFFLEEMPARFPGTRLFRLPYKWAYEFIIRKDYRDSMETDLHKEYAFFTPQEYRKNMRDLGARVLYTAPHHEESIVDQKFSGRLRLYDDEGRPLGAPPTSFVALAQKTGQGKSLRLTERRPARNKPRQMYLSAMRNNETGEIIDIVSRGLCLSEVLPYRITEDGTLNVFIHYAVPRAIANAVPRRGKELDGRGWSGHMIETISIEKHVLDRIGQDSRRDTILFARDHLALKPSEGALLEKGPVWYPAPDYIDERVETWFLEVDGRGDKPLSPKILCDEFSGFTSKGDIREFAAQEILDAINVGLIPNAGLEIQIMALFEKLGMKAETWAECPLQLNEIIPEERLDAATIKKRAKESTDGRFKKIRGTGGKLRAIQSVFVDEGLTTQGIGGLRSRNMEFVIADENTPNVAAILPLAKDAISGEVLVGTVSEHLPIPQRYGGNGLTMRVPTLPLPAEVTHMEHARQYIAEKFGVPLDHVAKMGEAYFCHIGITPQRIFPFVMTPKTGKIRTPFGGPVEFSPISLMRYTSIVLDFNEEYSLPLQTLDKFLKVHKFFEMDTVMGSWSMGQRYQEAPEPGAKTAGHLSHVPSWSAAERLSDEQDNKNMPSKPAAERKLDPR
ncbi:MAG: methyltransferase domain-containing protein [Alphaproteobacteria bacterium]|nr:methyltransferase domain-containing protein [Alphaproteobacteria bacterium]